MSNYNINNIMNTQDILKSIALTIKDPTHSCARSTDCHYTTAQYIKHHLNASDQYIVILGSKHGLVYHSFVVDDKGNVKSDAIKDVKFHHDNTVSYPNPKNPLETETANIIKTIPINKFAKVYLNSKPQLKEFLQIGL